ncbi:MAG: hypothetical protein GKR90_25375 [Pseudomonadales bacterium]|nr:hypothetical protein [Pseudomonadales bacterium]
MRLALLIGLAVMTGCSDQKIEFPDNDQTRLSYEAIESEKQEYHKAELRVSTPIQNGTLHLYHLLNGETKHIESKVFSFEKPVLYVSFLAPLSSERSTLLIHVVNSGSLDDGIQEYVCFSDLDLRSFRHDSDTNCGYWETSAYYLSALEVGRPDAHAFHDIALRLPLWRAISVATDDNLHGFYASVIGTLQNALVGMGETRFHPDRHSLRPVMETIVYQFKEEFQRRGSIRAGDLIRIANQVTDHSMPLERLFRFAKVFRDHEYVEQIELENTGGSFTRLGDNLELLTMNNEVRRFYLAGSPFEMSDYRTQVVQRITETRSDAGLVIAWVPISHMYGYNIYLNGQDVGFSKTPSYRLPADSAGTVVIKAVGYAGEFDGVSYEIQPPSFLASQ